LVWALSGCARSARPGGGEGYLGEGLASFYGQGFDGRKTANGEIFDKEDFTAAHRKLKFGACVRVESIFNGRSVKVRVNDRGPYSGNRIIDVSEAAARQLGMIERGVTRVRLFAC
jgi:rare lipoprotein A